MTKTVTLLDGTDYTIQYDGDTVCLLCGAEYEGMGYGYCDESLDCAMDSGEHLVAV
jgi:hypothetical protein